MLRFAAGLLLLCLIDTRAACAESTTDAVRAEPPSTAAIAPSPRVDVRDAEQAIVLRGLDIRAEVIGGIARTRVEMVFFNPNARILEGELKFPLLAGQAIDGFALDIDGELRDAVPVEKAKGVQVFEDTIRQRVDPALLESSTGENFRLRIYPLPANGTRRVVVYYSEVLAATAGAWRYRVPLSHAQPLDAFALSVTISGAGNTPVTSMHDGNTESLALTRDGVRYSGTIRRRDFSARGWLAIDVPIAQANANGGATALLQHYADTAYLFADTPVTQRHVARRIPDRIAIVWDASRSGATRDHAAEFMLLDAYFEALRNGEVELVRIRDVADDALRFRIVNGDWSALKRELQATIYDGGSDLSAWRVARGSGEVLLFSDGLANYGGSLDGALVNIDVPVHAVVSSASANRALLRRFARHNPSMVTGALIDLTQGMPSAQSALLQSRTEIESITMQGDAEVLADADAWSGGILRLHGVVRGTSPDRVRVTLRDPDGRRRTIELVVAATDSSNAHEPPLVARLWARARIDALGAQPAIHRAEITRLGKAFSLVTGETSLIVLDAIEDYVRHDIMPPASLQARFNALRATGMARERATRSAHLDLVARAYAEKVAWWRRDFPKDAPALLEAKVAESAPRGGARSEASRMRADVGAQPRAVMSMAPSAQSPADRESDAAPASIGITMRKWTPDAPYIARLRAARDSELYAVYLDVRGDWMDSSAFVLDVAEMLFERDQQRLALRVLSNLAELDLENRQILRILGSRLLQAGEARLAVPVLRQVRDLAPFEPQSFRDLGLALAASAAHQQAADALYQVVVREWDGRFAEVALIALSELNALIAAHGSAIDTDAFDPRLLQHLPVDLRVVLNWDADNSDMDLWVTDPNGERAYYGNRLTHQGGRMSADLTGGYGPEEFMLKVARPGKYKVEANYFGNRQQLVAGAVTLRLSLSTAFGTPSAQEKSVILRLGGQSETVLVGEFDVGGRAAGSQ